MIRRADKYLAQQHGRELPRAMGPGPTLSAFPDRTVTPDDYLSAQEPSEFEYDSEETDPEEAEDDPEEDDASVSSDSTYKSSGHDTDRTRSTNIINHNHRESIRNIRADVPLTPREKKIDGRARWSCCYSGIPRRRAP